jgi:hypothetical protein
MGRNKKRKAPQPITTNLLPLLKKPTEKIGVQIKLPGSFWELNEGRMSEAEKITLFKCTIIDFLPPNLNFLP